LPVQSNKPSMASPFPKSSLALGCLASGGP
jgi:hypothetical protein